MAAQSRGVARLALRLGRNRLQKQRVERIELKRSQAAAATRKWEGILREMEMTGQSGTPEYENYFDAYLRARQQEKQADLEAFNLRSGLEK